MCSEVHGPLPWASSRGTDYLGNKFTTCRSGWLSIILGLHSSQGFFLNLWSLKILLNKEESCQITRVGVELGDTAFPNLPLQDSPCECTLLIFI